MMSRADDTLLEALREKAALVVAGSLTSGAREHRPPASCDAVVSAETALGFALDPFLRRAYLDVCDGGIGPGYGSLPVTGEESLSSVYASFRGGAWPPGLLPVWDWGDAAWSCVDLSGRIVTHDDVAGATVTDFTTRSWLSAWIDGVDLWTELYDDKEATILNPFTRKPVVTKVRGVAKGRPWPG